MIIFLSVLLTVRNRVVYEISVEKYDIFRRAADDNIVRCMSSTSWINKARDAHSKCVILIVVPRKRWLLKRDEMWCLYVNRLFWYNGRRSFWERILFSDS
jgi:hypothetical protein